MRVSMKVVCECGNVDSMTLKRTADYSSITDSKFNQDLFKVEQNHPDTVEITCGRCGKKHDIST